MEALIAALVGFGSPHQVEVELGFEVVDRRAGVGHAEDARGPGNAGRRDPLDG